MKNTTITRLSLLGFALVVGASMACADDWPGWRGPHRDNKVVDFKAPAAWPKNLTKKWSEKVGKGESSPIMAGDKIFTFGRVGPDEVITCREAATGKEVWTYKYASDPVTGSPSPFPGTRSTPAVGGGKVCSLGVNGTVTCVDSSTGKLAWKKDTAKPQFYASTSPIITEEKCIVFGDGLTAYDLADGSVKWSWGGKSQIPYGSPVLMTVDGVKTIVTPSVGALAGVGFADGKLLWKFEISTNLKDWFHHYSTPLIDGSNVIYSVTPAKGVGGSVICLKIEKSADGLKATEVWNKKTPADKYHTPVLHDGVLFGVQSKGTSFFCMDAKTGNMLWTDSTKRGSCGSILDAGNVMLALSSDQNLIAFKASKSKFEEVAKYSVGTDETWAVPIVTGNRIYVKDKAGALTMYTLE